MSEHNLKVAVNYFKSMDEVSALYVFGPEYDFPMGGVGLGVLADRIDLNSPEMDDLEQDCILRSSGPLSVVMLDTAPLYLKHYVANCGRVLFERNKDSHLRFTRRAIDAYSSVAFDTDDFGPGAWGIELSGPFSDEEYLS